MSGTRYTLERVLPEVEMRGRSLKERWRGDTIVLDEIGRGTPVFKDITRTRPM